MTTSPAPASKTSTADVELDLTGMTCASCANRIERKLNKLDGVTALVNYATERAKVTYPPALTTDDLVATVKVRRVRRQRPPARGHGRRGRIRGVRARARDAATATLRHRLLVSIALTVPVIAMAMIPPLQFTNWQWASLTLAAPVVVWGGWQFHRAAATNLRHGTSTMDTLISLGTLAALGWSIYALFWGTAGEPGMKHAFELTVARSDGSGNITSKPPPASPRSSSPGGIWSTGPSGAPVPRSAH